MEMEMGLTIREKEVLFYMAVGYSRIDTARELKVERTTVNKHIEAIFRKFGVSEKGGAILFGLYFNILDFDNIMQARIARGK